MVAVGAIVDISDEFPHDVLTFADIIEDDTDENRVVFDTSLRVTMLGLTFNSKLLLKTIS